MRIHLVKVNGLDHTAQFLGEHCRTPDSKDKLIRKLIDGASEIWLPHGIAFTVVGDLFPTEWTAEHVPSGNTSLDYDDCYQAGALSPNRSYDNVNVYFIPKTSTRMYALSVSVPWARNRDYTFPKMLRPDPPQLWPTACTS